MTWRHPIGLFNGRRPVISDGVHFDGVPRLHPGIDLCYRRVASDPPFDAASNPRDGSKGFAMPGEKTHAAYAIDDGVIAFAGRITTGGMIQLKPDSLPGHYVNYIHMDAETLTVRKGDRVTKGQMLGFVGVNPNDKSLRHLHFELRKGEPGSGTPIDPTPHVQSASIGALDSFLSGAIDGAADIVGGEKIPWILLAVGAGLLGLAYYLG